MGGSGSKEKNVAVEATNTSAAPAATPTTPAAAPRYRPASKEAIAFRDATNAPAGGTDSILNQKQSRFDQAVEMKSNREYITEQEGLTIGEERKGQLAQQWRFILSAEPIQRGLDAGLIAAAGTAMGMLISNKANRQKPGRVAFCSMMGFCVGMMAVPMGMVYLESRNRERIRERDRDMMQDQRDDFYKKASDSFEEKSTK
jgi:hypothetical protein